jgi:diamine N-acetyltransferase
MDVVVRQAVVEDLSDLAVLNEVVQELHVGAEPAQFKADTARDEVEAFFGRLILAERTFVLVAETSGTSVGYIWFELQDRPATPFTKARRRAYIHHVVVGERSRRLGVGLALLRAAETMAQAQGINQIALDTWAFNEGAHDFFRIAGFEPFNIVMRKDIAESA